MSDFSYNINKTILHTDESFMPVSKKLWSSWNTFKYDDYEYVTYWMNNLQNIKSKTNLFVTIGQKNIASKIEEFLNEGIFGLTKY